MGFLNVIFCFLCVFVFLGNVSISLRFSVLTSYDIMCGSACLRKVHRVGLVLLSVIVEVPTVSVIITTWTARTARLGVGAITRV
jgi:hypothetical protein